MNELQMITSHDIRHKGDEILLGIAVENAVLDIVSNADLMKDCVKLLEEPHSGLVTTKIGTFGEYTVTLNLHYDEMVSIFVDGPDFDPPKSQSAGIYLDKQDALRLLLDAANDH